MTPQPTVRVMKVGPGLAARWLTKNHDNRPLRKRHLAFLIGVIKRGEWELSNDAICFDKDGNLLNGQHRLNAIVETGATLPLMVMENATKESQLAMDVGARRRADEHMAIMGIPGGSAKAALCRAILNYDDDYGPVQRSEAISNKEIIELSTDDPLMDEAISLSQSLGRQLPSARVSMVSLAYYLLLCAWPEKVEGFHDQLLNGVGLDVNSPVYRLRNYFIQGAVKQNSSTDRRRLLALMLKAFNFYVEGSPIEILTWRANENWPKPYTKASYERALAMRVRGAKAHATRLRKAQEAG